MNPTFSQKKRGLTHAFQLSLTIGGLLILAAMFISALTLVLSNRALTQPGKLALIALILITALLGLGLLNRLRR